MHAQPPHVRRQRDLRLRVQPQAEQPFGRRPGALQIAEPLCQLHRERFPGLQQPLIDRDDPFGDGQRFVEVAASLVQPASSIFSPASCGRQFRSLRESRDRIVVFFLPPLHRRLVQQPVQPLVLASPPATAGRDDRPGR